MKNRKIITLLILINIILIGIICSFINKNGIIKEKQIIKEMNEGIEVTNLNNQINTLNTEHTEYMNYIQACKTQIATALTNEGVDTSPDNTIEVMVENIGKILQAKTIATATATQILSGQTAWVNGSKVTGTMKNNEAVSKTLNSGGSYTIPAGYHNGSGKVTVNSLASQTSATATTGDILNGKTAWVNGTKITGTLSSSNLKLIDVVTSIKASDSTSYTTYTYTATRKCYVLAISFSSGQESHGNTLASTGDAIRGQVYNNFTPYGKAGMRHGLWLLDIGETVTASYKGSDFGGGGTVMYIFEA